MLTVEYEDEDPVSYVNAEDRVILECLKWWLGLTIRELYPMVSEAVLAGFDPIDADGDVFEFVGFGAPDPRNRVNLVEARKAAERDAKTCQMLLEGPQDTAEAVLRNSIEWLRFWQIRAPTAELREAFAKSLRRLETGRGDGDV
jgi:hypothetical protein